MAVIGRKEQIRALTRCTQSRQAQLVCIYGRRRVGKTYLVEQFFAQQFAFHAIGLESANKREQLKSFGLRLNEYEGARRVAPKDWLEAFDRLRIIIENPDAIRESLNGKKVVFLDEFPWFNDARSEFIRAFGNFWNYCSGRNPDLIVVICGSSTSWMIKNVIGNSDSLYKRPTEEIFLPPFTLRETEELLSSRPFDWDRETILLAQMVFGGLPFFLSMLEPYYTLSENIDRLCLNDHAPLRGEAVLILETTLRKSPLYEQILRELSKHRDGMFQQSLENVLHTSHPTFTTYLSDLVSCGYVKQTKVPHKKGNANFVQLIDPFLLFHFTFMSARSDKAYKYSTWNDFADSGGRYLNWRGHAFEILCQYQQDALLKALSLDRIKTETYPWVAPSTQDGVQIDLVIKRADRAVDICEMKFTDDPFEIDREYKKRLLRKKEAYKEETKTKWPVRIILVSVNGLKANQYSDVVTRVVELDDLF